MAAFVSTWPALLFYPGGAHLGVTLYAWYFRETASLLLAGCTTRALMPGQSGLGYLYIRCHDHHSHYRHAVSGYLPLTVF